MTPFMHRAYGKAAETDWHMGRQGGERRGFEELMADHWTSLSATSRPLLAQNAHRSLMACYVALDSRGAKGQVCLKFALPCISGDDLDFLSLSRSSKRWRASGGGQEERQPRFRTAPPPPFNCVSSPLNFCQSHVAASRSCCPKTKPQRHVPVSTLPLTVKRSLTVQTLPSSMSA